MSQRVTCSQMYEFFSSAVTSTSDLLLASDSRTQTKRLYFIDDLSAAKANGPISGNDIAAWPNFVDVISQQPLNIGFCDNVRGLISNC